MKQTRAAPKQRTVAPRAKPKATAKAAKPKATARSAPQTTSKAPKAKTAAKPTTNARQATATSRPKAKAKTKPEATAKLASAPRRTATAETKPEATAKLASAPRPTAKARPQATAKLASAPRPTAKARPEATAKLTSAPRPTAKARPEATAKLTSAGPTTKARPEATAKSTSVQAAPLVEPAPHAGAKPQPTATPAPQPRPVPPPTAAKGAGEVVTLVEAQDPIGALRAYLAEIPAAATVSQGQVALGSAQLMLLPIAREARGGAEVKELLDLVLGRWSAFPDRTGFHAQEFLRNAFAAVGTDRLRIARLAALVPADATAELRFTVACALAVAGDRDAMLRAIEAALSAGASADAFRRDDAFAAYRDDPDVSAVLERATAPQIPVDIGPHIALVRSSLDSAVKTLREFGEVAQLEQPASLESVLAAERAANVQLPNDYRALLTMCDGLTLWDHAFFGTADYKHVTELSRSANDYLAMSGRDGRAGIAACVPLANWGQPNDWLLYDPHGRVRGGAPGYVLMLNADECPLDGLAHALERFERIARDVLGTN